TVNEETVAAEAVGDGTYSLMSPRFERGGLFELVFDVKAPETDDLLIGKLVLPGMTGAAPDDPMPWYARLASTIRHGVQDHLTLMIVVLLGGLALGIGLRGRRRASLVPILVLAPLMIVSFGGAVRAHEGHAEDDARTMAAPGDAPRRLPDGRVFLP